jgi:polygalacturonase
LSNYFRAIPSVLFAATLACAQDTRTVTEPHIPATCTKLTAQLVSTHGAISEADEAKLDTDRIQKAMDQCKDKQAVELAPDGSSNAFLTGPLELRPGVTLLVDKGVTLFGSRNPKDYEVQQGSCGVLNDGPRGCKPLINANRATGSGIMGDGTIDGRGGSKILGQTKTWWDLAAEARAGGHQQVPRLIETDRTDDFTLYRITLKNSANFHVAFHHGDGFTIWALKIDTPKDARNTDGVDPAASKNITMAYSYIRDGDDNIAIKGGDGPVTNMTVIHNHFYWGHGMSIGSETMGGVSKIRVQDLSLDGTDAGIRIKSNPTRGGLVEDVIYNDVCIRDSKNPIFLDTNYSFPGKGVDQFPVYQGILLHNVRISGGKQIAVNGFDHTHRIGVQFDGVVITDNPTNYKFSAKHADFIMGPGPVNFQMSGEDSTQRGKSTGGTLPSCAEKFVPFPAE